ncbi:MAG TPA: trigger factor [Patescibacteria group bacterium]|nr:trigger factor [Patescibacteria group bacterium]
MQVTKKNLDDTKLQLKLVADQEQLQASKNEALKALAQEMKLPGFREGKAPLAMVEKQVDQNRLQSEFLNMALNRIYSAVIEQEKLRPVDQPKVNITKVVPFDTLEVEFEIEVIGEIKLPDYKNIKLPKEKVTVTAKDVDEVLDNLLTREAEKKDVDRASKDGDQVWIDFKGVDAKTKEAIKGADGKDYPLALGSNTFIPGFEPNLVGLKAGEEKTFTLEFPKDYGVKALQKRKVEFTVTVNKVQEVVKPKIDDELAAKVGPFKTVAELKDDVKKQLLAEKENRAEQKYVDDLITKIVEKSKVAVPDALVNEQIDTIERDQRQNLMYRGQTWQEFLESEDLTDETYREKQRPAAELRVKAGLILAQIAEVEKLTMTREELDAQMVALKARYPDEKMQAELDKPEARRDIASRMMTERTLAKLTEYSSAK